MNTEQNKIAIDLYKRLAVIGNKIFKKKNEDQIIEQLTGPKPKITNHLELIYLLIEDNCSLSKIFWDAFVYAQSHFLEFNHTFNIEQLSQLLTLVDQNNQKFNTEESNQLLNSLKEFISINGLIQKSSHYHIRNKETLEAFDPNLTDSEDNIGAIGIPMIDDEYKTHVIDQYKQILLDSILIVHGMTPVNSANYDFYNAEKKPSKVIRDYLSNHDLMRELDVKDPNENKYKDLYWERFRDDMSTEDFADILRTEQANDGIVTIRSFEGGDYFTSDDFLLPAPISTTEVGQAQPRDDGLDTVEKLTVDNFISQALDILNKLKNFSNLIDQLPKENKDKKGNFPVSVFDTKDTKENIEDIDGFTNPNYNKLDVRITPEIPAFSDDHFIVETNIENNPITFGTFINQTAERIGDEIPNGLDKIITDTLKLLINSIEARIALEDLCYFNLISETEGVTTYDPDGKIVEFPWPFTPVITVARLALVAGINNTKSIKNEAAKKDSILKFNKFDDKRIKISTVKPWLNDPKRKYQFYDLIPITSLTDDEITLDDLRKIHAD